MTCLFMIRTLMNFFLTNRPKFQHKMKVTIHIYRIKANCEGTAVAALFRIEGGYDEVLFYDARINGNYLLCSAINGPGGRSGQKVQA